jgi:hypothetical protein
MVGRESPRTQVRSISMRSKPDQVGPGGCVANPTWGFGIQRSPMEALRDALGKALCRTRKSGVLTSATMIFPW